MQGLAIFLRSTLGKGVLALVLAVLAAMAFLLVDRTMREQALLEEQAAARDNGAILAASLRSELDKFSLLPLTLAEDPQVASLLGGASAEAGSLDRRLEALANRSGAAAIYLMDADGLTLAASNWNRPDSFVGSDYSFRRYFHAALQAGTSTQFALGTVSRKPGLYIASRVGPSDAPLGVVAVKVEFDATEAAWRESTNGVYVTDANGVVLLASNEDYRFRLAEGANPAARDTQQDEIQFGIAELEPLAIELERGSSEVFEMPLLDTEQPLTPDGWVLHVLADPGPRVAAALATGRLVLVLALATLALLGLAGWLVRRHRLAQEEALVAERTRTLREQLTQANRLATLGQISAGVNHEIGQPVAALRVQAETGEKLLASGRLDAATENFRQIVSLADRIGLITGELRRFSRRQPGESRAVPIGEVIDGALLLLHDRLQSSGCEITLPEEGLRATIVKAEHVRLEQVLVNLLQNALDATSSKGSIVIAVEADAELLRLHVIDHGCGIPAVIRTQLFQPFATSKGQGLGLGLVISREIMRDMGGDLVFDADCDGTCFVMLVPRA